jgi:hypothetical protein
MLICDQIITEQVTNKKSLIGVFDKFFSSNFPALLPRIAVYVKLADAAGDYWFNLRIVNLKDESPLAEVRLQAQVPGNEQYTELALNMSFRVPEQGKYEFQLYADDYYLHRVTMLAELAQLPPGGSPQWQPQKP